MRLTTISLLLLAAVLAGCAAGPSDGPATTTTPAGVVAATIEPTVPLETVVTIPSTRPSQAPALQPTASTVTPESRHSGRLYYIGFVDQRQHVLVFDLLSGQESSIFTAPDGAWLSEVAVSPGGEHLLLAYAPPPEGNQIQMGFTALYTMPADGSAPPKLLVPLADPSETYFNISWPLEDTIYFAHYALVIDASGLVNYVSQVERATLPDAEVEILVEDAAWPRLSNDGARLAYVIEAGDLMLAAADGTSPQQFLDAELFAAVDAPLFSHDGSQLYFSAVDLEPVASLSPLDRLLGVKIAQAHSVPSDWWRMPIEGAVQPERLTVIDKVGLYGDFAAGGDQLYFAAADGLYAMNHDGDGLTQLQAIPAAATIDWTP